MVKFTRVEGPVVRVEGRLDGQAVPQLDDLCRGSRGTADLTGLSSVDRAGAAALRRLRAEGWRLAGASLYLTSLLEEVQA